ncbi:hypothetical protein AB0O91_15710 [Kitasatospora sp. NPDC089797]|uniref:hypothetical protein n=1 Tax=Kitasatospora sp. NPDC089797 TaxID=3155298 RepID=UPI003424A852
MLLLGLLLMAASGAFAGLLIADNLAGGPSYQVTILGTSLATVDSLGIFLSGLGLALLFCLGLAMMGRIGRRGRGGSRRTAHRAAEPVRSDGPTASAERAAEQGGRAAGIPTAPPSTGRRRHLFGH